MKRLQTTKSFAPDLTTRAGRQAAVQYLNQFGKTGANGEKDHLAFVSSSEEKGELADGGANTINREVGVKQYYDTGPGGSGGPSGNGAQGGSRGDRTGAGNANGGRQSDNGGRSNSLGGGISRSATPQARPGTGNLADGAGPNTPDGSSIGRPSGGVINGGETAQARGNFRVGDNGQIRSANLGERIGDFVRAALRPTPPTQDPGMNLELAGLGTIVPGLNAGLAFTRGMQAATGLPGDPPTDTNPDTGNKRAEIVPNAQKPAASATDLLSSDAGDPLDDGVYSDLRLQDRRQAYSLIDNNYGTSFSGNAAQALDDFNSRQSAIPPIARYVPYKRLKTLTSI
jgi:hypothetical protein